MTKKKSPDALLPAQKRTLFSRIADFLKNRSKKDKTKPRLAGLPLAEENAGMDKEKTPEPKGLFPNIAMKEDKGEWYALMIYEETFGTSVSESEKKGKLEELRRRVESSGLPEGKRKPLLDHIEVAAKGGGRFSMVHSQAIVLSYLEGAIPEEQLPFEFALMKAWCAGKIKEFLEKQGKELNTRMMGKKEKGLLNEMIDLALTRESDTVRAVAAINLGVYFEGLSEMDRIKKFGNMVKVFRYALAAD